MDTCLDVCLPQANNEAFGASQARPRSPTRASRERLGARRRIAQFRFARVRLANAQVFGDRTVEQEALLKHHADIVAERGKLHVAHIDTVDLDRARLRIEGA